MCKDLVTRDGTYLRTWWCLCDAIHLLSMPSHLDSVVDLIPLLWWQGNLKSPWRKAVGGGQENVKDSAIPKSPWRKVVSSMPADKKTGKTAWFWSRWEENVAEKVVAERQKGGQGGQRHWRQEAIWKQSTFLGSIWEVVQKFFSTWMCVQKKPIHPKQPKVWAQVLLGWRYRSPRPCPRQPGPPYLCRSLISTPF